MSGRRDWLVALLAGLRVGLAVWILWPGVHGNFYLDDFPNLSPLETAARDGAPLLSFLLDTAVGGLGRPLAYLTFLLQKDAWPDDPFAFKLVNLVIHVFNAVFVFFVANLSLRLHFGTSKSYRLTRPLACACALIWMVLPVHTSAIFYVVQRMTLLSAAFSLVGIVGYLWVRYRFATWGTRHYLLAGAFVLFGYAGILAKENAIQTGLLIWALELTVLSKLSWRPSRVFRWGLLIGPFVLLILYLFTLNDVLSGYTQRDFTLLERLLTQAVIFWEYVFKVLFPTPSRLHLFNDGGEIFTGLFSSPKVILAVLALLLSFFGSIFWRRKYPWLAFGLLFFCFGHLLESTFIPLEMNFEHRNYLPSVGLIIGTMVFLFLSLRSSEFEQKQRRMFVLIFSAWLIFITSVAMLEARTWGNPKSFALSALLDRPKSPRARQEAAAFFISSGEYLTAANLLYSIESDFGLYAGTYGQILLLKCYDKSVPVPTENEISAIFKSAPADTGADVAIHDIWQIKRRDENACSHLSWNQLIRYVEVLISNESFSNSLNLKLLLSFINADLGKYAESIRILEDLPDSQKDMSVQILIIRFYIMDGKKNEAKVRINGVLNSATKLEKAVYGSYLDSLMREAPDSDGPLNEAGS